MTTNYVDSDMKYRKKPVIIEATQWFKNGDHPLDYSCTHDGLENGELRQFSPEERKDNNWEGDIVRYFRRPEVSGETVCKHCSNAMHDHGWVDTLEGGHIVCPGDWIITGVEGEHYPCKPHIFEQTYEPAAHQTAPDIQELVEALESLIKGYVSLLEAGRDRITSLGGDCDPVPVMEQNDPWLRDARAALATYRKGGGV